MNEDTGIKRVCAHCGKDPGRNKVDGALWNGFFDGDTGELSCFKCHDTHYKKKWQTEHRGLFTEYPVPYNQLLPMEIKLRRDLINQVSTES